MLNFFCISIKNNFVNLLQNKKKTLKNKLYCLPFYFFLSHKTKDLTVTN